MSAKHTPGPWAFERCYVTPCYHVVAGAYPFGTSICEINEDPREGIPEANARLIAAAPEMLTALQKLHDFICAVPGDGNPEEWDRVKAARAAIAKAEGQDGAE